jgi:hypothetical protein
MTDVTEKTLPFVIQKQDILLRVFGQDHEREFLGEASPDGYWFKATLSEEGSNENPQTSLVKAISYDSHLFILSYHSLAEVYDILQDNCSEEKDLERWKISFELEPRSLLNTKVNVQESGPCRVVLKSLDYGKVMQKLIQVERLSGHSQQELHNFKALSSKFKDEQETLQMMKLSNVIHQLKSGVSRTVDEE